MNKICQSTSMQLIYVYQEYRITTVYAQTVFSNQPITSNLQNKW